MYRMKNLFSTLALRLAFVGLTGATGLLTTACGEDEPPIVYQDYRAIDEDLIKQFVDDHKLTNAQRQPSGLYFVPLTTSRSGIRAAANKTVSVLYTGMFLNGTVFDASAHRGNQPFDFVLGTGQVIAGWDEGIALMEQGDKALLLIPSALAYGPNGRGAIPPNKVLRFEVELKNVQ